MRKLKLLLVLLALTGATAAWGQASYNATYKNGVVVAAGENYFLYNIGSGMFLTDGMDYGTHASVDHAGRVITLAEATNGFTVYSKPYSANGSAEKAGFLFKNGSNEPYVDGADDKKADLIFTPDSYDGYTNVYTIKISDTEYLYYDTADNLYQGKMGAFVRIGENTGDAKSYWLLIPMSDRQAAKDYTYMLRNTDFHHPWELMMWESANGVAWTNTAGGLKENACAEMYGKGFDISQTISATVANGLYKLYNQAFYNNADNVNQTYLYANNDKKAIGNKNESTAANMAGASTAFSAGEYVNEVSTIVTDGKLKVGMKNDTKAGNAWNIMDNFYLEYLGPCIGSEAVALPAEGEMEADKWYYFDIPVGDDYQLTSSTLGDIVYTKDGSILTADASSVDATFGQAEQNLEEGRYYVKSSSANSLTVNALSYSYVVGEATSSIADGSFVSTLTTVDFTFNDALTNDQTAPFAILDSSAKAILKKDGSEVAQGAFSLSGKVLTATFSGVTIEVGGMYTIEVPSGVVGYEGHESNSSISIAINGPTIANGIYYFKRNGADYRYLTRGGDYGTENVTDRFGIAFEATVQGDGSYTLKNIDQSLADNKTKYLNRQYTDQEAAYKWFIEKTDGGYLLKREGKYVTTTEEPTWHYQYLSDAESSSDAIVWTLLTEEEYAADLAQRKNEEIASVANGIGLSASSEEDFATTLASGYGETDMTNKITNASLQSNADGWTALSYNNQRRNQAGEEGNKVDAIRFNNGAEVWNYIGGAEQTIEDLPAGLYKITVKAVWRIADADPAKRVGDKANVTAWMYANDNYTQLKSWYDHQAANNAALRSSTNDEYVNTVYVYLNGSEDLTIGLASPTWCGIPWMPFYDWKLKKVEEIRYVSDVTLNETSASLNLCDELYLSATVAPEDAHNKDVEWTTSDESVAKVDNNGKVIAVGQGSATITATAKDGSGNSASMTVSVVYGYTASSNTDVTSSSFVADDYYVLNVATGKFLGGANSWGTQASLIKHGIPFGVAKAEDGTYTLDSYTYNGENRHFFDGTYVDAVSTPIYVESKGSGRFAMYTLVDDAKKYVTAKAGTTVVDNSAEDGSSEMAQWMFLSVDDMMSNLSGDATFLIREANVSRNLRISNGNRAWTGDHTTELNNNFNDDQKRAYNPNYVSERYHAETNVWQTIAVPNGTYKVRVQGFYRPDNGSTDASYLYANNEQVALNTFVEGQGVNADMLDVSKAFLRNMYWNELTVTVTDNRLTVGIRTDDTNNWTIWDNFELYQTSSGSRSSALIAEEGFITADNGETYAALNNAAGTVSATTQQRLTVSTNDYGIATISTPKGLLFWDNQQNKGVWADGQKHVQKTFFYPYWAFEESGNGYRIRNIQSGLYLTVADGKLTLAEDASEWRFDDVASESDVLSLKEKAANAVPTLGFESGEYAPYNNVEALQTVAQIQNTNADGMPSLKVAKLKTKVDNLSWTSNYGDVEAIYDGSFAIQDEHTTSPTALAGWTAVEGIRQLIKNTSTYPGLNSADEQAAVFSWGGTVWTYGQQTGYTLPLAAHTVYELTMKVAGWVDGDMVNWLSASVLKGDEGLQPMNIVDKPVTRRITEDDPFVTYSVKFMTGEAGDYVLNLTPSKHNVMTDISLKKSTADEIVIDEDATEAPASSNYANVTLNRGFNAGWNAVCLPFNAPAFNDGVIVELAGEEGESNAVTLKFRKVDSFKANKPYLVYFPADVAAGKTFDGIAVTPGEVKAEGTTFDFMGTYTAADVVKEGDYVIAGGKLSKANQTITLKGTRTYFTPKTAGARLAGFTVDGETTGVGATLVKSEEVKSEQIFDLKGVRVSKPTKGVFIQNGKKVVK